MNQKKQVSRFKKSFNLKVISSIELSRVIEELGYTIVRFNGIEEEKDVETLKKELNLGQWMNQSRCFTFQNERFRLVFLQDELNEEEKQIVLAHEVGHIWNKHFASENIIGYDILQEYEANEFAHYLLFDKKGRVKRTKRIAIISCLVFLLGIGIALCIKTSYDKSVYTDNLFRTKSGRKYHLRDCVYLKDKTDIFRLTEEELNSGKYEPCEVCKPDEKNISKEADQ